MSDQPTPDFRPAKPLTDEELLHAHEQITATEKDDGGSYKLLPLVLLFLFSGLIFFGGTYLNLFSGHFSPKIFDERNLPHAHEDPNALPVKIDMVAYGKKQYESFCHTCHQPNGLGIPGAFPPLAKSEWVQDSEERLIRIVLHGLNGPVSVAGVTFNGIMPAAGPTGAGWSDDRIAAVLTYIRQEWGNKAGPIATEKVTEVRTKDGTRKEWTAVELEKIP